MISPGLGAIADFNDGGEVPIAVGAPALALHLSRGAIYAPLLPLRICVSDPRVFDHGSLPSIKWTATVMVGGIDVSERLSSQIRISAAESAARTAELTVTPATVAELMSYDQAQVSIDITIWRAGLVGTWRRFTGIVERVGEINLFDRSVTLSCRDGYQERPRACKTADEVHVLLGGLAHPCAAIVAWSDSDPAPDAYFRALGETVLGCTFIDASGFWRVVPWAIGSPSVSLGQNDVFDTAPILSFPSRADTPSSIEASLTVRVNRLHCVEVPLMWEGVSYVRAYIDLLSWPTRAMVKECLSGIADWHLKGSIDFEMLPPGSYGVIHSGNTSYLLISYDVSIAATNKWQATMYTRWAQTVDHVYKVVIDLGGTSDRDSSVTASIESTWDAAAWEQVPNASAGAAIYARNAPASEVVKTGYEGLPSPYPPANSAIDFYPDLADASLDEAIAHLTARAARQAADGRRRRTLSFEMPIDPRWEIGDVIEITLDGCHAIGQVIAFDDALDHDTGDVVSAYTLAVPEGIVGEATSFSVQISPPVVDIEHTLAAPILGDWIGAGIETPADPDESLVQGYLQNISQVALPSYDGSKPVYNNCFRVVMPEIPAAIRDPEVVNGVVDAAIVISGGVLDIDF